MKKGVEMSQIIFKEMLDRCVALLEKDVATPVPRASLLRCRVRLCCGVSKCVARLEKR